MRKTQPKRSDFVEHAKPDILVQAVERIELYDPPMEGRCIIPTAILQTDWGRRPNLLVLFLHLLLRARPDNTTLDGVVIPRGCLLVSRNTLSAITGLSVKQVRGGLDKLKDAGVIGIETRTAATSKATSGPAHGYTIVSIIGYEKYSDT